MEGTVKLFSVKCHVADGGVNLSICKLGNKRVFVVSLPHRPPRPPGGPYFPLIVPIRLLAGLVPEAVWTL